VSPPTARSSPGTIAIDEAKLRLPDPEATRALGARLAGLLRPGDLIGLEGELGAGKSALARAIVRARAGAEIEVPSPTFTLVQAYDLPSLRITHIDLYRLREPDEVDELGLEEALDRGALLVEWPERAGAVLPADRLTVRLELGDAPEAREAVLCAGPSWVDRLARLVR
jgi:tRNA threonylcarbamoyl adenosine modification protein YjeE